MPDNKLSYYIEKYKLNNILKILVLLLILFLTYRIFTNTNTKTKTQQQTKTQQINKLDVIEGFTETGITDLSNNIIYGNVITLMNKTNKPVYSGNTCILNLDNKYRIDTLVVVFNNNTNTNPVDSTTIPYNGSAPIYIQFQDGNGNLRNMSADGILNESPPNFKNIITKTSVNNQYSITLTSIKDENMLDIYTSKIIITIGDKENVLDTYNDSNGNNYISNFGIYGGERDLMKYNDYSTLVSNLSSIGLPLYTNNPNQYDSVSNMDNYIFGPGADILVYALKLTINSVLANPATTKKTETLTEFKTTSEPFPLTIKYDNTIYPGNDFTLSHTYYIRSDINSIQNQHAYIYFTKPVIANKFSISVKRILNVINNMNTNSTNKLNITALNVIGRAPVSADISTYKQNINTIIKTSGGIDTSNNICPSINELVDKQTKTQQICDNLEYQDKIKTEKLRLERNKQYLLKLQDQQNQVDQLNIVIQDLENKRKSRATSADQVRVLQYQKQKADSSTIRDLANQRLESQDNNNLYMNVKVNTT